MPTIPRILVALSALLAVSLWARTGDRPGALDGTTLRPARDLVRTLNSIYGETVVGRGLRDGIVVELLVGPSGTWSMLVTQPSGLSCLVADGEGWGMIPRTST